MNDLVPAEAGGAEPTFGGGPAAEVFRVLRHAAVAGCVGAAGVFLVLGPPPARSFGPPPAASAEVDAAIAAWIAEAEKARRPGAWTERRDRTEAHRFADRPTGSAPPVERRAIGADGLLDLNRATAEEIAAAVSGFGEILSERLVAARPAGGWRDWSEIQKVEGIGPRRLAFLRESARL